jgi:biopolymer transport protein ExbB
MKTKDFSLQNSGFISSKRLQKRLTKNKKMVPTNYTLRNKLSLTLLLATLLLGLATPELIAQAAAEGAATDAAAAPPTATLMTKIIEGGVFMIPIGIESLLMITLAVFNFLQLSKKKFCPKVLEEGILANMADVKVRSAIDMAAQDPSYLGRMVTSAYPKVDATDAESLGRSKVEDQIADFSAREQLKYMTWIGYFSVLGQSAPMLGLFGTVAGMVMAFDTMGLSGGSDPGALARNISIALMTTAGGLVVAIPSIFFFYLFKNKFNALVSKVQGVASEGMDLAIATVNADQQLAKVPEGIAES